MIGTFLALAATVVQALPEEVGAAATQAAAGAAHGGINYLDLMLRASLPVKLIVLLLLAGSLISWVIIFRKLRSFKDADREADEFEQGAVPGSVFLPRGHLESQVEGRLGDKAGPVVVMCAGGVRSAFAARTLGELGYTDVVSMAGGFNKWKDEGRDWRTPQVLTPEQRNRYQRHLLVPEVGEEGQQQLLNSKVLLLGDAQGARLQGLGLLGLAFGAVEHGQIVERARDVRMVRPKDQFVGT